MIILDPYVSQTTLDVIGYIATAIGLFSALPQLIVTIKSKNTKNLSILMITMMILGNVCWMTYGLLCKIYPMVIGNAVVTPFWIVLFILKIINTKKAKQNTVN